MRALEGVVSKLSPDARAAFAAALLSDREVLVRSLVAPSCPNVDYARGTVHALDVMIDVLRGDKK